MAGEILISVSLFFAAAILEIGGGYLVWLWLRENKKYSFGIIGGIVLFLYGILPTLQPSHFSRVYAAYGGIFIISSIIWGFIIDRKMPDRFELIGALISLIGAFIIFYTPR